MKIEKGILIKVDEKDIKNGTCQIPEGVTSIGFSAFSRCSNLTSINIPRRVRSIGEYAFFHCSNLTSIEILEGVTSIGDSAFSRCSNLTSIKIPEGVTSIGFGAFERCSNLTSIKIPESVTSIDSRAFADCSNLTSIEIPEGVTSIGDSTFAHCSNLTSIKIPESVTSIGDSTFAHCSNLTSIKIPESVTNIDHSAFAHCSNLTSIEIPEGVTSICSSAFADCSNLTSIKIPKSVKSIDFGAFADCSNLTSIEIPEGVTSIGCNAFYGCSNVTSVKGNGIKRFGRQLYFEAFPNNPELYPYVYGEDAKRFEKLREKSLVESSKDYNPYVMAKLYHNMYKTIGIDAMENLLHVDEVSMEDIDRYYDSTDDIYRNNFEKKYKLVGDLGNSTALLQNIGTYLNSNNAEKMKVFQVINQCLENEDEIYTLEDVWKKVEQEISVSPKITKIILDKSQELNTRKIEANLLKVDSKFEDIYNELGLDETTKSFSKRLITQIIKEEFKDNGKVTLEHIIEEIEQAEIHVPAINAQREKIVEIATKLFEQESKNLNHGVIDELKNAKQKVGQGWIRKLLQVNPNMKEEDLEKVVAKLNSPNITVEDLIQESQITVSIKEGVDEKELYKQLEDKQIKGIVTYHQLEQMFGEMHEPYSEEFKKWFSSHKDEILSDPESYLKLAKIHNNFDNIINKPELKERYKKEGISVEHITRLVSELKHDGELPGEEEMGDKFDLAGVDPKYYPHAQALYKEMKVRESTKIPQIEQVKTERYRGRIRRMDDANVMFDGNNTTCCQRFGDVGEAAMLHAAREGAIFVVEKLEADGRWSEVGQSWVWRNKDRVCFDNIEVPHDIENAMTNEEYKEFVSVYQKAAQEIVTLDEEFLRKQLNEGKINRETYEAYRIAEVTVGMGYVNRGLSSVIRTGYRRRGENNTTKRY